VRVTFLCLPYKPAGVFLIDQWRQIGVKVEHKQVETAQYREGIRSKTFDVAVDFTNAVLEDPALTLTRYLSGAPDNPTGAEHKEVDACFEQLTRDTDLARREALVVGRIRAGHPRWIGTSESGRELASHSMDLGEMLTVI
jgi:peptide/nickel transport system substrate-binding protein